MEDASLQRGRLIRLAGVFVLLGAITLTAFNAGGASAGDKSESQVKLTATASKIESDGRQSVTIKMQVNEGWHAYANPVKNEDLEPNHTLVKIAAAKGLEDVSILYPLGKRQTDGTESYQIYEGTVEIQVRLKRATGDNSPLQVTVEFSACNDKLGRCLPREAVKLEVK